MTTAPTDGLPPRRRARRAVAALVAALLAATTVSALSLLAPTPAGAAPGSGTGGAGQTLTVSQVDALNPAGTLVTVTGTGFNAAAGFDVTNGGLYLSVCLDRGPGQSPSNCLGGVDQSGETPTSRWITNNPIGDAEVVPIAVDGSFETTLLVTGTDSAATPPIDCRTPPAGTSCKVVTRVDHRASGDRSQDVKVPIAFTGRTAAQSFVTAALTDFLGTTPTTGQVNAGVTQLNQVGKAQYLRNLSTSDAWLKAVVNRFYRDTLGRDGSPGDVAWWTGELRSGRRTVAQVGASFYSSNEYFNGIGGGSNPSWVNDLYVKVLLRPADTAGRNFWVGEIQSKGRGNVAYRIYQSPESARTRVRALYQALLGRGTDAAGLNHWYPRVLTQGDLALAVNLAASGEYATRANNRFP